MRIIANLLFVLAAIAGLVPTLALLTFWDRFPGCPDDLSKYQTLLGPPILAASLALIGAALTSWNQQIISAKQLGAQRREQDQALSLKRQQIASTFIGEIDIILNELHKFLRPAIENALRAMESGGEEVEAEVVRIDKHLRRSFENSPTRVRLLPKQLSGELMRFYYLVEETRMDVDWYYRDIEIYVNQNVQIIPLIRLERLLKQILAKLHSSENLGRILLEELKKIRDTNRGSLDQPETLGHRVRANCAPGNWYQKLASTVYGNDLAVVPSNEPPRRRAKLRLTTHAQSWLNTLMPFVHAAKLRLAIHAQSWLSRLMPFIHAAKLRLAMRLQPWLNRLMPFVHAAIRLAIDVQSWLSRLMPFVHAAKLRLAAHAQSWLSRLTPLVDAGKLRLAIHAQSCLSRLIPFVRAAKLRLAMHAQSRLNRITPFLHAAKLRLAMHAQSCLSRLMPFAFVRFLVIFFIGVVTPLAWRSYGDATVDAIARWSPHCGWRRAAFVEQTASAPSDQTAPVSPDRLRSTSIVDAAMQRSTNSLSIRDYQTADHRAGHSSRRPPFPSSAGVRARKPAAPVR
jgi:branched-subunit amino acid transport protein